MSDESTGASIASQIVAGLGILAGAAGLIVGWIRGRRRDNAEAEKVEIENDITLIGQWRGIVEAMRQNHAEQRAEIAELRGELADERHKCDEQLLALGARVTALEGENRELRSKISG